MNRTLVAAAIVAVAGLTSAASASTVTGGWTGASEGLPTHISTFDATLNLGNSGGMHHVFSSASDSTTQAFVGGTLNLFCTDGNWAQQTNNSTYTLNPITSAPIYSSGNLGRPAGASSYTANEAQHLNALANAGRSLGILDSRGSQVLSFNSLTSLGVSATNAEVATAFQLLVWESLWENWGDNVPGGGTTAATWNLATGEFTGYQGGGSAGANNTTVQSLASRIISGFGAYGGLADFLNSDMTTRILTVSDPNNPGYGQDMLVMVPLPPAAYAGLGSLAGVAGIGLIRRRRLQAV